MSLTDFDQVATDVVATAIAAASYDPKAGPAIGVAIALDGKHSSVDVKIDRTGFPDTKQVVVHVRLELSLDGGITWSPNPSGEENWPYGCFPIEFAACGGAVLGMDGQIAQVSGVKAPMPSGASRQVRVIMTPFQPLTTKVDVALKAAQ